MYHKNQTKLYYVKKDMYLLCHKKKEKYSLPLMKKLPLRKKNFISIKNIMYFQKTQLKFKDLNKVSRNLEIFAKIISTTMKMVFIRYNTKLWHINHCRLLNAKSIFMNINSNITVS